MKAFIVAEEIPDHRSFMPSRQVCEFYPFFWHVHPNIEMFVQIEGPDGGCVVGDHAGTFRSGEIYLVGANLPHSFYTSMGSGSARQCVFAKIHCREDFAAKLAAASPESKGLLGLFQEAKRGLRFSDPELCAIVISRVAALNERSGVSGFGDLLLFLEILRKLEGSPDHEVLSGDKHLSQGDRSRGRRLERICAYLHKARVGQVGLDQVARHAGMSVSNLCSFFKRSMNVSVIDYVNELRVNQACKLLAETDESVINIAAAAGFKTLSHFNRQFKKHKNATPSQYRKMFHCSRRR